MEGFLQAARSFVMDTNGTESEYKRTKFEGFHFEAPNFSCFVFTPNDTPLIDTFKIPKKVVFNEENNLVKKIEKIGNKKVKRNEENASEEEVVIERTETIVGEKLQKQIDEYKARNLQLEKEVRELDEEIYTFAESFKRFDDNFQTFNKAFNIYMNNQNKEKSKTREKRETADYMDDNYMDLSDDDYQEIPEELRFVYVGDRVRIKGVICHWRSEHFRIRNGTMEFVRGSYRENSVNKF